MPFLKEAIYDQARRRGSRQEIGVQHKEMDHNIKFHSIYSQSFKTKRKWSNFDIGFKESPAAQLLIGKY